LARPNAGRARHALLRSGGFLFVESADEGHLDVGGVPRGADHVECAFSHCLKIELPFTNPSGDDDTRNFLLIVVRVNQIRVRTVGEMFVAEDNFK